MDVIELATQILVTGVRHGKGGIERSFGDSVDAAVDEAFAELHKNNLPEESLVFLLKRLFARQSDECQEFGRISANLQIDSLLDELRSMDDYKRDSAVVLLSDFQHEGVLKDLVICLAQALRGRTGADG